MSPGPPAIRIWGVVPAAGLSRRMGKPKQLLPCGRSTMVGSITQTLVDIGLSGVVVVTRRELVDRLDLPPDPSVLTVTNDDTGSEMIDSVRLGLASLDQLGHTLGQPPGGEDGVLVIPADMPGVRASVFLTCLAAYRSDPSRIVIASHAGRRGHPIIFPFALKPTVERLEGTLRGLPHVCRDRVLAVEIGDSGVPGDIDTPDDYERFRG